MCLWQTCSQIRAEPHWQWFMLVINLVNVSGLICDDTSCDPGDCTDDFQNHILPVLDMVANVLFTIDMLIAMVVLGFASYFDDKMLVIDFVVVFTGWIDAAGGIGMDFSSLRALRVLRPLRLVKYFQGIQAIVGAIYYNLEPIWNVIQFMLFFLTIFGIAGITLFSGKLQSRCVVTEAYGSQTAGITYDSQYAGVGDIGGMGELEYLCTSSNERVSFPFPYRCASHMTCDTDSGNPHHGSTSFDNFGGAFLLMFQVQTLSTWWEYDYYTQMTVGWYTTFYYEMVVLLVGFIVSQLFIAVVCFGFDNLSEQLQTPVFSDLIVGKPYVELETEEEDNLCRCLNPPVNPLLGAKEVELDRGTLDGIRVHVKFLYHYYAPAPLDVFGSYDVQQDPCDTPQVVETKADVAETKSDVVESQANSVENKADAVESINHSDSCLYLDEGSNDNRKMTEDKPDVDTGQTSAFSAGDDAGKCDDIDDELNQLSKFYHDQRGPTASRSPSGSPALMTIPGIVNSQIELPELRRSPALKSSCPNSSASGTGTGSGNSSDDYIYPKSENQVTLLLYNAF